jgi:uncharacterized membrane protein
MWLHLLAAIVWIGGLAFISMVLAPTLRDPALRGQAAPLLRAAGRRFMRIGYASLAVLLVTGAANLFFKAGGSFAAIAAWWLTPYGLLLAAKLALVALVIALSLYHDFVVGPAASRAMQADPLGAAALALRRRAALLGRTNALLSLVIMTVALLLVRGLPS